MAEYRGIARVNYIRHGWRISSLNFCVFFCFWVGLALLLNPIFNHSDDHSIYANVGGAGLVIFGLVYVALSLWAALFPEQGGSTVVAVVLGGVTLYSAIRPFSIIGIIFALSLFVAVGMEVYGRLHPRGDG